MPETNINIVKFDSKTPNFAPSQKAEKPVLQKPEVSGKFLTTTAREMQVPITTLTWNTERLSKLLGETANSPEVAKILRRINEANGRLVTLVEDLLNVAKMQEGALTFAKRPMQIVEVVRRALRSAERAALQRGVVVKWSADATQIPLSVGDPEKIYQVVLNLLTNAIKYTPRGGSVNVTLRRTNEIAPVSVASKAVNPGTGYVLCSVEDTGIGIPKDEQKYVFTQFFRGRKAVATDEGGTGLGLYIVKGIVEQHNGAIWFTSREGYGSTFYFTLPLLDPYKTNAPNPGG